MGASSARTQDLTGRSIATGAALLALAVGGLTMTDRALGAAPPAPPICAAPVATTFANTQGQAIPDAGQVTSTITVSGAPKVLRDIDLRTSITHGHTGDLRITLTHNGKTVMIKDETTADGPDPGSANGWADLWNGTLWDDNAGNSRVATDFGFTADGAVSPLVPEAALGRFIGDDPNGVWTLTVQDVAATDTGSLNSWSLDIAGLTETPPLTTTVHENTSALAIPDNGAAVTRTINVTGAKGHLWDVNLQTFLAHTAPTDLDVTLSHLGRTVTITTDNGGSDVNLFNGTKWDDSATTAVTVDADVDTVTPEEAMAAFVGMDPNGIWTISVKDDAALDTGSLNKWSLTIASTDGCVTPPVTPPLTPPVTPPATPPIVLPPATPPTVTVARLAPRKLGLALSTRRDRLAPYKFAVSGSLVRPVGSTICAGKVAVTLKAGKKTVTTRTVALRRSGANCTYRAAFSLKKKPATLPKSGALTVSARFVGTALLTPRAAKVTTLRLG